MLYFYAFSVLFSAFLLFQVQPMIGKYILPWFGGTPTVWSTVLLFFQVLLTAGYGYAYWLLERMRGRRQGIVHLVFLGISLGVLAVTAMVWPSPLTPDAGWRPQGSDLPIWGIIRILTVAVAIPYLLLASNSTLMQAWFGRDNPTRTPYRLYALSNAGSLLALISYPVIFEPNLTLRAQSYLWTAGYVVFAISTGYLALRTYRRVQGDAAQESAEGQPAAEARPSLRLHVLWIALAACASTLLISVTSQVTQEVAVVPFLWVIPLTIYLLTFILAFSGGPWYSRRLYLIAFFILSFVSVWMLVKWPPLNIVLQIVIYMLLLFVCCMICHSELYRLRPSPRFLPSFYLMVAVGGAIGGIFVNLIAPYLFSTGLWELQWGLVAIGLLLALVVYTEHRPAPAKLRKQSRRGREREAVATERRRLKPAFVAVSASTVVLGLAVVLIMRAVSAGALLSERNFYGVSRVWEINADDPRLRAYELTNGKTVHGFQFIDRVFKILPTTFYADTSGVGLALLNHPARPANLKVGVLGLGIGVLAGYGQPGDAFRFYEINPDVIRIAEGEDGYFSFLTNSQAEVRVIPGDARVSLERELANDGPQDFDLLVLDTFSGDAMPVHLLTEEAFQVYLRHLKPDGIIAVNVSNRYFDLDEEVFRLADALDLGSALIEDKGDGIQSLDSAWMLLTRNRSFLQLPAIAARTAPRPAIPANVRIWTDNYSNLLRILRSPSTG
jgi:SAM-dependent methyltransferase